jgi:hypothetical protein
MFDSSSRTAMASPHVIAPSTIPTRCRQVLFMIAHSGRGESDGQQRNTSARYNHRPV